MRVGFRTSQRGKLWKIRAKCAGAPPPCHRETAIYYSFIRNQGSFI